MNKYHLISKYSVVIGAAIFSSLASCSNYRELGTADLIMAVVGCLCFAVSGFFDMKIDKDN